MDGAGCGRLVGLGSWRAGYEGGCGRWGVSMFQILALILDLPRGRGNSARTVSIMTAGTSAEL